MLETKERITRYLSTKHYKHLFALMPYLDCPNNVYIIFSNYMSMYVQSQVVYSFYDRMFKKNNRKNAEGKYVELC